MMIMMTLWLLFITSIENVLLIARVSPMIPFSKTQFVFGAVHYNYCQYWKYFINCKSIDHQLIPFSKTFVIVPVNYNYYQYWKCLINSKSITNIINYISKHRFCSCSLQILSKCFITSKRITRWSNCQTPISLCTPLKIPAQLRTFL